MLQQTRVEAVVPYYERWIARFPTLESLTVASQEEVLYIWEGLGYYSRARNIHAAARIVLNEYNGEIPHDVKTLRQLPGIGAYTAAAISSIAFGQDEAALDGNVRRVLARAFDIEAPLGSKDAESRFRNLLSDGLPYGRASDYNQALMDLGATICLPRAPSCSLCPLNDICRAYALGIQKERPVRRAKLQIPHYIVTAAVIRQGKEVLIARRPEEGLLGGLWEFPGGKLLNGEDLTAGLKREITEELAITVNVNKPLGVYHHAYTHYRITLHAFECFLANGDEPTLREHSALAWVFPNQLDKYPMGKVDRQISHRLMMDNI
jgi:A/G-specific adenine glycosylase